MSADEDTNIPLLLFLTTTLELRVLPKLAHMSQGCVFGDLHPGDNDRCRVHRDCNPNSLADTTSS